MARLERGPTKSCLWRTVSRKFIKCVITVHLTDNIKCIRCVKSHGGKQEVTLPSGRKHKKRSAIVPTCLIDFFKTSAENGRACCNSMASHQADGMDAYQIRIKSTDGANLDMVRGDSVVRSCSAWFSALRVALPGTHTELVKSIPPTKENWPRKLYKYSMKNDKSTEDRHETNHINNKYNDTNMNTRKMHNT